MPHIGGELLNWLAADFHFFGWDGQNWMPVLLGGAVVIFVAATFWDRHNGPPTRV